MYGFCAVAGCWRERCPNGHLKPLFAHQLLVFFLKSYLITQKCVDTQGTCFLLRLRLEQQPLSMYASAVIEQNKNEIIEQWLDVLKKEFPQVKKYGKAAIEDDAPDLLDALIEVLESNGDDKLHFAGAAHGIQRTNFKEYSLTHVIKEYRLLKRIIFHVLDENKKISPWERDKIMYAIDQATEEAAEKYFQYEQQKVIRERDKAEENVRKYKMDDELRDDFITSVSHDLNNPINNIKFAVQLLEEEPLEAGVGKLLKVISSNTSKAERLIKDLLDVNRVNSGARLPLMIRQCNLVEKLEETVEGFQLKYGKNIELKCSRTEILAKIDCDALMRAIDNLIDNALKYGDKSKPVTVGCHTKDSIIEITVSNFGKAIPLEKQAHIFSRFYRIDDSQNKGWGIGLPLAKAITEAHGGKLSVHSIEGEPTTFTIEIPLDSTPFSHNL